MSTMNLHVPRRASLDSKFSCTSLRTLCSIWWNRYRFKIIMQPFSIPSQHHPLPIRKLHTPLGIQLPPPPPPPEGGKSLKWMLHPCVATDFGIAGHPPWWIRTAQHCGPKALNSLHKQWFQHQPINPRCFPTDCDPENTTNIHMHRPKALHSLHKQRFQHQPINESQVLPNRLWPRKHYRHSYAPHAGRDYTSEHILL